MLLKETRLQYLPSFSRNIRLAAACKVNMSAHRSVNLGDASVGQQKLFAASLGDMLAYSRTEGICGTYDRNECVVDTHQQ